MKDELKTEHEPQVVFCSLNSILSVASLYEQSIAIRELTTLRVTLEILES